MFDGYTTWRVARVFFDEPTATFALREVGRKAGIAHSTAIGHLATLTEAGIVATEEETHRERTYTVYLADQGSTVFRTYKRLDMLHRLTTGGLVDRLERHYAPDCIVLFGSAARGEDVEGSDVDLFVQAGEDDPPDLGELEETLHRSIELHVRSDARDLPRELRANLVNGVVLYGYLEVLD